MRGKGCLPKGNNMTEEKGIIEISRIEVGDMTLIYEEKEEFKTVGFSIIPTSMAGKDNKPKFYRINSLVQCKIATDKYPNCYGMGTSMRNCESANFLDFANQEVKEDEETKTVITHLIDNINKTKARHIVTYYKGDLSFELKTEYENASEKTIKLQMLSSFELANITPFIEKDAPESLLIHRLRSKWSQEGRLVTETAEDLQLEPSWSTWSVTDEKYGQVGSMPVKKYFPFVGVEDKVNHVLWGAQLAVESSWQIEIYRQDDGLHISGGLADEDFGQWSKNLKPGEVIETPKAIITTCEGDIEILTQRLTQAGEKYLKNVPASEQSLPIIFNEYCTTWGNPSHENICGIVDAIKDKGFDYFVIDCGWFKEEGVPWDVSMGDYEVSPVLFKEGLSATVKKINDAGMKAGLWFEIDNIGPRAKAFEKYTDHMLKRDGVPITTYSRRFWDMTDPWVKDYLTKCVIDTLNKYKFEYIKMDYNDTIGAGAEGFDSLGEGLRLNMEASVNFVKEINTKVPGIIIENCSSGGHKLEPLMMSKSSMASFSDAHECPEIPIIAADLHRAILPRQSQIWCVIRQSDSLKRIAYSLSATFLGRMCLSGDVTNLTNEQWNVIDRGIAFYKLAAPIIKEGFSRKYRVGNTSDRHPKGYQALVREGKNGETLVVIHTFAKEVGEIKVKLPKAGMQIKESFSDTEISVKALGEYLYVDTNEEFKGIGIILA